MSTLRAFFPLDVKITLGAREKWEWVLEELNVHVTQQRVVPTLEDMQNRQRLHVGLVHEIGRSEVRRLGSAVHRIQLQ